MRPAMTQATNQQRANVYHVMPNNDVKDHSYHNCWCEPRIELQQNGGEIVVHNSADGREFFETDILEGH